MTKNKDLLVIIDCFALIHRAFHAFPDTLVTSDGEVVNAVFGFASLVSDVLLKFKPTHVICVFDPPGPTIRNSQFADYKAHRGPTDTTMLSQLPRIREVIEKFNIPLIEVAGFEADDVIGTLSTRYESLPNHHTIIVTGDRDLFQLVDHNTSVYLAGSSFSQSKLFDAEGVKEKMGVTPAQIIDIKSLEGDASDNIPGVEGIGKAGAVTLVSEFGNLDNIYANLDKVPNRYKQKLIDHQEMAYLSRKLATILLDVPISFEFKEAEFGKFAAGEVREIFAELEFRSLLGRLDKLVEIYRPAEDTLFPTLAVTVDGETVADTEFQQWSGQALNKELIIYVKIEGEDSCSKQIKNIVFISGDEFFQVAADQLDEFAKALNNGKHLVIANDVKSLIQIFGRLSSWYDIVISGTVISGGTFKPSFDDLIEKFTGHSLADLSLSEIITASREIYKLQKEKLAENKLRQIIDLEMKVIPVVAQMELNGIKIDKQQLIAFKMTLEKMVGELEQNIYKDVGHEFNIASPKQVGEVLFGERGLPSGKKNKGGGFSTNERILRDLVGTDPVVEKILKFREVSKLLSTYVSPFPSYINERTGRVHGNMNQIGAVTGRFSSDRPNLQNIPIRDELGQSIRKAFTADTGKILVSFDYSQQELRILAEVSQEPRLVEAFNSNQDIHSITAADLFEVPLEEVTKEQRRVGKTVNFGVVYGISAFGLADRLKIDPKKAASFIDRYFTRYPRVRSYFNELIEKAQKDGYVYTIMGRRRSTTMLSAGNYMVREAARREIMNYPLQGSAADFMKVGMVGVADTIKDYPAQMVLQIHDELLLEYTSGGKQPQELINDKVFQNFIRAVYNQMSSVAKLNVKFEVEAKFGHNWLEMQHIKISDDKISL